MSGEHREAERSYLSLEWERLAKGAVKRAETAEAEVARLRAVVGRVEALVACGEPDEIEECWVRVTDLRAALEEGQ